MHVLGARVPGFSHWGSRCEARGFLPVSVPRSLSDSSCNSRVAPPATRQALWFCPWPLGFRTTTFSLCPSHEEVMAASCWC